MIIFFSISITKANILKFITSNLFYGIKINSKIGSSNLAWESRISSWFIKSWLSQK